MGGKTKQSQRTKNNARPSSSSRSAELLHNGGSFDGGFITLGVGKPLPPLFPTLAATANLDQGLKPEFQICFKKLTKKDPITRAKALQELCELISNGNIDEVEAALPSWAHVYKVLTADTDRRVRELTQVCHGTIVRVCGRRTAPQLKSLLPAWLQAQYDDHAPAMTHAHNSLTKTFPDSKLPEVISFCKAEVVAHLLDNLIGNAEAIITKRVENEEERALQVGRVVSSSLQGLQYFLRHLPPQHSAWLWEQLAPLLQHSTFWKYAQGTPQLRAAWYGAVGGLVERFQDTFWSTYGTKTLRLLLDAARELHADAALPAQVWGCLILAMHHVKDWHKYLDKKELLIKRILDILENGGWGDARHLQNILLPLLAHLPQDILTKEFYEKFFAAIFVGLQKKNILNSKSERQSWITSLAECLRYLSIQQNDFVLEISTSVHRTWLETVLSSELEGQTRSNLIKCSATNMASILKYWLKQSKQENSEKYDQLVRNFWQNVGSTVLTQIDKCNVETDEITKTIDGHILLLQTLKCSFTQDVKKQQSIKFHGDEQTTPDKSVTETEQCDVTISDRYKHNLEDIVHKVCCHYFESAKSKQISSAILTPLYTLLVEFDSKNLFLSIARQFEVDSVYKLYDSVFRSWLSGDTMRSKVLVDIIFLMMKYMTEDEQESMFNSFEQFPPVCVEWVLCVCVREPAVRYRSVRRWAGSGVCAATVRSLCARAATHGDARAAQLLHACLADGEHGEPLMSEASISEVVDTVSSAVQAVDSDVLEGATALCARLTVTLHDRAERNYYTKLLTALFTLHIRVPRGDSRLSCDTWREVRSSWQDGVAALPQELRMQFLTTAVQIIHQQLLNSIQDLNDTKIENMLSPCPHLFTRSEEGGPSDVTEIVSFTKLLYDLPNDEALSIEAAGLRHLCVTSQLNCLYDDNYQPITTVITQSDKDDVKELNRNDLMPYLNKVIFRAVYLRNIFLNKMNSDDNDVENKEEDEEQGEGKEEKRDDQTWCDLLLKDEYMKEQFCITMHNYAVVNALHDGFAFWPDYIMIDHAKKKLDSIVSDIVTASTEDTRRTISDTLCERALKQGYYNSLGYSAYSVKVNNKLDTLPDMKSVEDMLSGNGFFHTLQASMEHLEAGDREKVQYLVMVRSWYMTYTQLDAQLWTQLPADLDLDPLVNAYYKHNHTMLYDKDISAEDWSAVVTNAAVVECLTSLVTSRGWSAPAHHWDFTTITLCSLLTSLNKTKFRWGCTKAALLTRSVLRLYCVVHKFVTSIRSESERRQPAAHVLDLLTEWKDIFAPDTNYNLFSIILHVLDSCTDSEVSSTQVHVITSLIDITDQLEWEALPSVHRSGTLSLPRIVSSALDALQHPAHRAYKHLAYRLLVKLAKPLILDDAEKLSLWCEDSVGEGEEEKERPQFCIDMFHHAFIHLHDIVDAALSNVTLGEETCEMICSSDSYSMALGWLLLVDVLATLSNLTRGDLTHHYVNIFKERRYSEAVLSCALRLLPASVFAFAADNTSSAVPPPAEHMFLQVPPFTIHEVVSGGVVSALSCRGVYTAVCGAGCGGARGWWSAAPARAARLLTRLVRQYVAPSAAREHLLNLHQRAHELEDTQIRIAWSTQEVTCLFNVEERQVEVRVWLARDHPLTPPRLAAPDTSGPATNTHWVALYLAYQNGTLLNALKMWTRAVSARVESSPQCYICYCRLHPTTGRLPRVLCHQCKNKFHNICLRKWFQTSQKSNCPLCRSTF